MFIEYVKDKYNVLETEQDMEMAVQIDEKTKKQQTPEDILRSNGFKIKTVIPTSFGTEFMFARKYKDSDISKALEGFSVKLKNRSVFVE